MAVTKLSNSGIKTGIKKYDSMLAGNAAFDPAATWLIQRVTPANGTASITFSSIPQTYQHLQIRCMYQDTVGTSGLYNAYLYPNADTGNNYNNHQLYGNGSTVSVFGQTGNVGYSIPIIGTRNNDTQLGVSIVDIHDYTSTSKYKTIRSIAGADNNGSGSIYLCSALWMSTSAITSLKIDAAASFKTGTTFALYGFK
jgi:hypothetical protein